jgi:hypothetical protein
LGGKKQEAEEPGPFIIYKLKWGRVAHQNKQHQQQHQQQEMALVITQESSSWEPRI